MLEGDVPPGDDAPMEGAPLPEVTEGTP
jgi:hypothetical protein